MNKLIIFDLDGVLIDSREIHFDTLNYALGQIDEKYVITKEEHLSIYDGLPTTRKLELLSENKGLPTSKHNEVWKLKQEATVNAFLKLEPDYELIHYFKQLKKEGYYIAVASNSAQRIQP